MTHAALLALLQQAPTDGTGMFTPELFGSVNAASGLRALVMIVVGSPTIYLLSRWARSWGTRQVSAQVGLISGKLIFYLGFGTLVVMTMTELGFSLTPLLGAAGVVGIALGFASQTSVSNIIAGLFLLAESPFVVGDLIKVDDVTGFVLSVDTMSVKLRTFDNRFVRIPNDTLVKSTVTTITRFPIRRVDVRLGVAYKESPERVREVLGEIAAANPLALMEPKPIIIFEGFGDSSLDFLFAVWVVKEKWVLLNNSIRGEIWDRFLKEGIEIPFPHRTLYVGSETDPFPVRVVQDEPSADPISSEP